MIGHPKYSGPIRALTLQSHEPMDQRNYQTKPISYNPKAINGLRLVPSTAGWLGQARRIAPEERRYERTPLLTAGANRATTDDRRGRATEPRITKQTKSLITPFDPAIYGKFAGGGSEPRKGETPTRRQSRLPKTDSPVSTSGFFPRGIDSFTSGLTREAGQLYAVSRRRVPDVRFLAQPLKS